jgi:RES domain-containing protein
LSSGRYPADSGAGAALDGGRWNPKGVEVIYAAATASLAALEVLVHFSVLPRDFVLTEIQVPASVAIESVSDQDLPPNWQTPSTSSVTQEIGRRWAIGLSSAVLSVPSATIPVERNYVLNPRHAEFRLIKFLASTPFRFDPRLKGV